MTRTSVHRPTPASPTTTTEATPQQSAGTTVDDIDELLDEIDAVLEENSVEVLRAYVQRGGE